MLSAAMTGGMGSAAGVGKTVINPNRVCNDLSGETVALQTRISKGTIRLAVISYGRFPLSFNCAIWRS